MRANSEKPVSEMTAADLHEMSVGYALGCFDNDGLTPTFSILDAQGVTIVCSPWQSEAEKNVTFEFVSHKLDELNAKAYSLCHEIYVAVQAANAPLVLPSERSPSERDEVVMISTYSRDGQVLVTRFLITPARQGHDAKLGPRVDEPDVVARGFAGRMFNLFRPLDERVSDDPRLDAVFAAGRPHG